MKSPRSVSYIAVLVAALCIAFCSTEAQQNSGSAVTATSASVVPRLVSFSGVLNDASGKPVSNLSGVTFLIYRDEQGGAPLWLETQNVSPDKTGHYSVQLGATRSDGLPSDMFLTGEARWLAVQIAGDVEKARVLLVAVPYAMKAADAETVGGLPPSAFVLAAPANGAGTVATISGATASVSSANAAPTALNVTTTGGTSSSLPLWTTSTNIQSSTVSQIGTGSTAKIGIGTTTPGATLDVKGGANIQGLLTAAATGMATSAGGKNSQADAFVASSFNSSTLAAVNQTFQWKAEATGNNTSAPSATLNLLFGSGTTAPVETGLRLSNKGVFTFATGQTFPGTGTLTGATTASGSGLTGGGTTGTLSLSLLKTCTTNQILQWNGTSWVCANAAGTGTITGVTTGTGSGLIGGGTSGTLTMSLLKTCTTNQLLQWNGTSWVCATVAGSGTISGVTAGTDLTGGGTSGSVTLNLDTTKVPQLSSSNVFSAAQVITSNASSADALTITNNGSGAGINITSGNGTAVFANAIGIGSTGVFGSGGLGGIGVQGFGTNNTGVLGNSTTGSGLVGQTGGATVGTAGVYGVAGTASSVGSGIAGVWGTSVTNVGVFGNSTNQTGAVGQSGIGNGVAGYSNSTTSSGVAGVNTNTGPGVYGHSDAGFGFVTDGNVNQARSMGGWVKVMAYVDPFATGGIAVTRCFNSQETGSAVSTPPCGISINHVGQGQNILDFGFQVNDRFVVVNGTYNSDYPTTYFPNCPAGGCTANQLELITEIVTTSTFADQAFFIFIY
ncbi:MAG TPA: hypothetical protein VFO46_17085 [Candidatus Sulfotelmatobacter sp.]|nr:hypothetical protein [Candidatus Sulfotelmatobacter sp.]